MSPVYATPIGRPKLNRPVRGVPLRWRLIMGILVLAGILTAPLLVARFALKKLSADIEQLQARDFRASVILGRMRLAADTIRRGDDQLVGLQDSTGVPTITRAVLTLRLLADSLNRFTEPTIIGALPNAVATVAQAAERNVQALTRKEIASLDQISTTTVRPALAQLAAAVSDAEDRLRGASTDRVRLARDETENAQRLMRIGLLVALIFGALVAAWIVFSISRPVDDLELGMERVAAGQFDHKLRVASRRSDEFGKLAESYATMAQRLGELDRLKAEFVSMASHELKTPLNVIQGYLTMLDDGMYGPLSDKQRDVVHTIERQSHSLNRLVRQLLDVSKYDAGGAKLSVGEVKTERFFHEMEQAFTVLAQQRGISFSVTRGEQLPDEVWWDRDRMTEAIGNLITNACKFTPRGGVVAVTADGVVDGVRIEVRDSGVGIPASELPHVFRKFFQAGNQDKSTVGGTGLGLAIVRGIVEAHGGSAHVSSDVGVGTTFTLLVPQRASAARRLAPSTTAPVAQRSTSPSIS
jgi:signal transduction histidine kinase